MPTAQPSLKNLASDVEFRQLGPNGFQKVRSLWVKSTFSAKFKAFLKSDKNDHELESDWFTAVT